MSCGQIALSELGVPIERYYASEIDKHAIKQTQLNFPETIQLGDVEKWREWDIEWSEIDLLLAGSPCQGFSLAGKMLGHDDPRSRLYWVFLDILHHVQKLNPSVKYLLENVRMRPSDEARINESLGIRPVVINSALVSAQNRVRLYWSDIRTKSEGLWGELLTDIPQPADRGIYIGDILDDVVDGKYTIKGVELACGEDGITDRWLRKNYKHPEDKAFSLVSSAFKGARANGMTIVLSVGSLRFFGETEFRRMKTMKSPCLNAQSREDGNNQTVVELAVGTWRTHKDGQGFRSTAGGKAPCIPARARNDGSGQPVTKIGCMLRRLTPTECSRLQTIPDWYKWDAQTPKPTRCSGTGGR